jgi:DNA-binding NarL/FixJ family response regulator
MTLLIVHADPMVRQGLQMRLTLEPDIALVGEARSAAEALQLVQQLHPDALLMDHVLPDRDGITAIPSLRAAHSSLKIVILSLQDDPITRARASTAGATAFVGAYEGVKATLAVLRHMHQRHP